MTAGDAVLRKDSGAAGESTEVWKYGIGYLEKRYNNTQLLCFRAFRLLLIGKHRVSIPHQTYTGPTIQRPKRQNEDCKMPTCCVTTEDPAIETGIPGEVPEIHTHKIYNTQNGTFTAYGEHPINFRRFSSIGHVQMSLYNNENAG